MLSGKSSLLYLVVEILIILQSLTLAGSFTLTLPCSSTSQTSQGEVSFPSSEFPNSLFEPPLQQLSDSALHCNDLYAFLSPSYTVKSLKTKITSHHPYVFHSTYPSGLHIVVA